MYPFLLTLLILDGFLLGAVVLLQAGQGGGLASLGGGTTDLVVGGRQAATLLTKLSWICGGLFLVLALLLSLVSPKSGGSSEVLERLRQSAPQTQPADLPLETVPAESGGSQAPIPSTNSPLQTAPAPPASKAPAPPAKPAN